MRSDEPGIVYRASAYPVVEPERGRDERERKREERLVEREEIQEILSAIPRTLHGICDR